jgi:hypothetical protein
MPVQLQVLQHLAEARSNYFWYRRNHHDERQFLSNETRFLDALEREGISNAILQLITIPIPGAMDPVIVAPTTQQRDDGLIPNRGPMNAPCAICQDSLSTGGPVSTLRNCRHSFHQNCANTWYSRSVFCPLCRNDIRTTNTNQ